MAGAIIAGVDKESLADEIGLEIGDVILKINDKIIKDLIQFQFEWADDEVTLEIEKNNGQIEAINIEKDYDEPLGVVFESAVFDDIKRCQNKCVFCFVDQLPPNMRSSLYIKDDDYRLSFLQGGYITLTNLRKEDIERIKREHLSPLYVSVQAADAEVRKKLLNNKKAGSCLEQLKELSHAGIEFHTQVVLCPGLNDGLVLEGTYEDLKKLAGAKSLALVPVGLTKYREGLTFIKEVSRQMALDLVYWLEEKQQECMQSKGSRFVWLSDEFYLKAGKTVPAYDTYEDFPQLENGVGMIRLLWHEVDKLDLPPKIPGKNEVVFVTGKSGEKAILPLVERINAVEGIHVEVKVLSNSYFGPTVTVTGLLTGTCLFKGLSNIKQGSHVFIPDTMLKNHQGEFLDDYTPAEVENKLGIKLYPVPAHPKRIWDEILEVIGR